MDKMAAKAIRVPMPKPKLQAAMDAIWSCTAYFSSYFLVVLYRLLEICARFGRVIMRALVGLDGLYGSDGSDVSVAGDSP